MNKSNLLDPATLLGSGEHRLTLQATLQPVAGLDRFQPAGFPEIGHVIYDSPRRDGRPDKICIVDSAASMANHLEAVCLAGPFGATVAPELAGLPYVECVTDEYQLDATGFASVTKSGPHTTVMNTFTEGHRLASSYFCLGKEKTKGVEKGEGEAAADSTKKKRKTKALLVVDGKTSDRGFYEALRDEFNVVNLGTNSHPLPQDWWRVFKVIFKYDPNSLVHGILFPALGIKIPRVLTGHLEAFGAARVGSAGVKFDKLLMTTSGQPIFAVDEETAREIRATFIIDLALLRSFGRTEKKDGNVNVQGLSEAQKRLLLALALWKIGRLLAKPFRYRSRCDLEIASLRRTDAAAAGDLKIEDLEVDIADAIRSAGFPKNPVTQVYWPAGEIFKKAKEKADTSDENQPAGEEDEEQAGGTNEE